MAENEPALVQSLREELRAVREVLARVLREHEEAHREVAKLREELERVKQREETSFGPTPVEGHA